MGDTDSGGLTLSDDEIRDIATHVQLAYAAIGEVGKKPGLTPDGKHEWTILASIVLRVPRSALPAEPSPGGQRSPQSIPFLHVPVTITTGVKTLPYDLQGAQGDMVHDSHAEVLSRRALRGWVLQRLVKEKEASTSSEVLLDGLPLLFVPEDGSEAAEAAATTQRRMRLRADCTLAWYVSTLPCGDASTALLNLQREAVDNAEGTPGLGSTRHDILPPPIEAIDAHSFPVAGVVRGRSGTSLQGRLRTKPGRADALPSISHSCTDKLALWNIVGLQGSLMSEVVAPLRAEALIVGDSETVGLWGDSPDQESLGRENLRKGAEWALSGRVREYLCQPNGEDVLPLPVYFTDVEFEHSRAAVRRRNVAAASELHHRSAEKSDTVPDDLFSPSHVSFNWARGFRLETIVGGVRQGASSKRKGSAPVKAGGRSRLCKLDFYRSFLGALPTLAPSSSTKDYTTYFRSKQSSCSQTVRSYRSLKANLRGESPTIQAVRQRAAALRQFLADSEASCSAEGRSLRIQSVVAEDIADSTNDNDEQDNHETPHAPFSGWLVSGAPFESFDKEGKVVPAAGCAH